LRSNGRFPETTVVRIRGANGGDRRPTQSAVDRVYEGSDKSQGLMVEGFLDGRERLDQYSLNAGRVNFNLDQGSPPPS